MPLNKKSNAKLKNSVSKKVVSMTKSLTGLQSLQNKSHKVTCKLQGLSQSSTFMLADKEIAELSNEALVPLPNGSLLSGKPATRKRRDMLIAAKEFIKICKLSLNRKKINKEIFKCEKLGMTTEEFVQWLKVKYSTSSSSTLTANQDPAKHTKKLSSLKQKLKSLTLRSLWKVAFRFQDGVLLGRLQGEFKALYGITIPYKELGYRELKAFIGDIPDVIRLKVKKRELYAEAVRDSSFAYQQKALSSTSNESLNCVSQSSWETSSNSSLNTSKFLPTPDLKVTSVERSLEGIQSVSSSYSTIASISPSPVIKAEPMLTQEETSEPASLIESDLSNLGYKPTLNCFPEIKSNVASAQCNSLLLMNCLLYGDDSYTEILKREILGFDGFPFSKDSDEWKQKQFLLSMFPVETLQECLKLLCIECDSSNKQVLLYKLMQFLSSPSKSTIR